jgi:hypothetical protein
MKQPEVNNDCNEKHTPLIPPSQPHLSSVTDSTEPSSDTDVDIPEGWVRTWKTFERSFTFKRRTFIKRELNESELIHRKSGEIVWPFWGKERLKNEAAALEFITSNTTIPVPEFRLYTKDGLLHLETARITDGVLLEDLPCPEIPDALKKVDEQINSNILPQLRKLRRNFIGSVDASLPVFPPQRIHGHDRRSWPQRSSETADFVFCHNDLAPQNIFVDPRTYRIVGIIDWEYAGFFPPEFELCLWKEIEAVSRHKMYDTVLSRDLAFFGLKPEDIRDMIPPPP